MGEAFFLNNKLLLEIHFRFSPKSQFILLNSLFFYTINE